MGKSNKITVKYINMNIPQNLGDILANADEGDLRILLALMMAANEKGEVPENFSVSDILGIPESDVAASLKFWRGAGVIGASRAQKSTDGTRTAEKKQSEVTFVEQTPKKEVKKTSVVTLHKDGAVPPSDDFQSYGSAALATLLEKRRVTAELINESQRVFGKIFNSYDTGIIVWLVDELGFEEESVLLLLSYSARMGKRSLKYVEKLALNFYDSGYSDAKAVAERISVLENSHEIVTKIKKLYGVGSRSLTTSERNLFEKWTQKFGYDMDVIRLAYDITVDNTKSPEPRYTNAILEKWNAAGLRGLEEIKEYEKAKKEKSTEKNSVVGKSYDVYEFFEVAFKDSLKNMK